jgi:ABC-type polysaccharide/polyol phosphate export permease
VRFPRQLVPLSMVATQLVGFAVMLVIVVALSLIYVPEARDTAWLAFPLAALVVLLVAGLSLAVASLNAIYRDVEHLVAALLLPWFFLTPVLYSLDSIPGVSDHPRLVDLIHWGNPITPPVEALRDPLFFGQPPAAGDTTYLVVAAVLSLALGAYVFRRVDDRVAVEV